MNRLPPPLLFLMSLWDAWQSLTREGEGLLRGQHGLSLREFIVLSYVGGGDYQPSALAEALGVPRYDISRTLAGLQAAELLSRSPDPADARRSHLQLTEAGEVRRAAAEATVLKFVAGRLQALESSPELPDALSLSRALFSVAGSSESLSPHLPPKENLK
ncbi:MULTISPECIES: MarR family winged helix-turn-helix transcriptional regulator [Deinococcus]|uniref:MarR family winged helix-turn-helix transcriptional regulator n=1 Tax=Deinococcus TaxID=1298 RepID=UPI000319A850|nr:MULTISPECIES: MarR family winged helix-turn-helix transcriptional regulator [Deinococcus]MCY1702400.1 MarR family winged helix-turn-helix transcriptional regulator [Deinococcus sp. SL84]